MERQARGRRVTCDNCGNEAVTHTCQECDDKTEDSIEFFLKRSKQATLLAKELSKTQAELAIAVEGLELISCHNMRPDGPAYGATKFARAALEKINQKPVAEDTK